MHYALHMRRCAPVRRCLLMKTWNLAVTNAQLELQKLGMLEYVSAPWAVSSPYSTCKWFNQALV